MTLNIVSWNIFASFNNLEKRTIAIADTLSTLNADVILLQEVVPFTSNILLDKMGGTHYSVYGNVYENNTQSRCFGEMILVKKSITVSEKRVVYFPTYDGRCATIVTLHKDDQTYVVATTHLEGKPSNYNEERFRIMRNSQIDTIKRVLNNYDDNLPIVFCGDFNFKGNETFSDEYLDAWVHLGSSEHTRYTWNKSQRYDRAYCKNIVPKTFIKGDHSNVSDHDYINILV